MTSLEKYTHREARMQNFRWATPAGLFILTLAIGFVGWVATDELNQLRISITDLKTDEGARYDKIWTTISSTKSKIDCVQTQLAKCCKDSAYCV